MLAEPAPRQEAPYEIDPIEASTPGVDLEAVLGAIADRNLDHPGCLRPSINPPGAPKEWVLKENITYEPRGRNGKVRCPSTVIIELESPAGAAEPDTGGVGGGVGDDAVEKPEQGEGPEEDQEDEDGGPP